MTALQYLAAESLRKWDVFHMQDHATGGRNGSFNSLRRLKNIPPHSRGGFFNWISRLSFGKVLCNRRVIVGGVREGFRCQINTVDRALL